MPDRSVIRISAAAIVVSFALGFGLAGCGQVSAPPTSSRFVRHSDSGPFATEARSDAATIVAADVRILFIGNSHTMHHNVPDLVGRMIRHATPGKLVATHTLGVGHLRDAPMNPQITAELDGRPWTHVVLQGQAISMSGKFRYSTSEGIDLAKRAKANRADVLFFAEWARQGHPDERERTEAIYREMAESSGASVISVGRAWEAALAQRPDLPLHDIDGNHESETGTFLTACVIATRLTGISPDRLAEVEFANLSQVDRRFLAGVAGTVP